MSGRTSRYPGFYRLPLEARVRWVAEQAGLTPEEQALLSNGGLTLEEADHLVENVIGRFALPFAVAVNFLINGREILIPMVIEEPSVVAALSHAARLARAGGGFHAGSDEPIMRGQIQVMDLPDLPAAARAIEEQIEAIRTTAEAATPSIVARGGGFRGLETILFPDTPAGPMLVVHLLYDVRDAMGANAVNTVCEAVAPLIARITGGRVVLRILSNLADRRRAWAEVRIPPEALETPDFPGDLVIQGILEAQALAEVDPYRAATHNKGIMNGIDAVALATGNDWRAIEAGAHAYAARNGQYRPLTRWWRDEGGALHGRIELPLAVGIVGGATQAHPLARVALKILGVSSARELAEIMAAVGLAQNLAALRALATEGIQRGHMELHARQIAMAAGAAGQEIDRIAQQLVAERNIRLARARELLQELRGSATGGFDQERAE
ncbi:3-hydroxy-3-methylglutaryl-coenzyme A reductase [Candidatus Thermoflexus japonica]|uniref:3-hydroxy-3-methylglutaryl coenzyme A reductase n=1 Tax=Candidatus Thermoflexus japonica TaxID=2035417 RepID=A0A2H5Y4J6_9CHLR|nr:3-hydroxy-3-methylglutaryl-coenzyme A reductase [Candidatus Thermoflexus japonica]